MKNLLTALLLLIAACSVQSAVRVSELATTNVLAGTNTLAVVVYPRTTNGTRQVTVDNLFSNRTMSGFSIITNINGRPVSDFTLGGIAANTANYNGVSYGSSIYNAVVAASAAGGGTVFVGPGTYYNCTNLLRNNVNLQGFGNPLLTYTNRGGDRGYGTFDDRFGGACTSVISGFSYLFSTGFPTQSVDLTSVLSSTTNASGPIVVTNPASRVSISGDSILLCALETIGNGYAINALSGTNFFKFNTIDEMFYGTNYLVGTNDIDDPVYDNPRGSAIWWESGECHYEVGVSRTAFYAVYCSTTKDSLTGNFWMTANKTFGVIYTSNNSSNTTGLWKGWFDIKEHVGAVNVLDGGGKWYYKFDKLSPTILFNNSSEVWLDAQKFATEAGNPAIRIYPNKAPRIWLKIGHFEDLGFTGGGGFNAGIEAAGGSLVLEGMDMRMTNNVGVFVDVGASAVLKNCRIALTSVGANASNAVIVVKTNSLTLDHCTVIGRTNQFSISAPVTNSVRAYWSSLNNIPTNIAFIAGSTTVTNALIQ